jgi:pimeloyl-ACP methyl ester carboxylesterase
MTVVLVHGNPETAAVWDPMVNEFVAAGRDKPVRLSPPGFGAPVPPGWGATVEEYRDWLVAELEAFNAPVDLVGHDWGGGHVLNVAMTRPDLMRTWCSDVVGVFDPDYVWHDLAQVWQREGAGEDAVAAMAAAPAELRAAGYVQRGMSEEVAARVALGFDSTMADCILKLYRSAAQPAMAQLGTRLEAAAARPGLSIQAADDHAVGTDEQRRRSALRAGARVEVLDDLGHWWMTQDPQRGAAVLTEFWTSV